MLSNPRKIDRFEIIYIKVSDLILQSQKILLADFSMFVGLPAVCIHLWHG